uniref:Putative rhomboid n=1 Tax=Anopheles darlingi TaxID=43151 RepID=A0A2M4CJL1_ANODA
MGARSKPKPRRGRGVTIPLDEYQRLVKSDTKASGDITSQNPFDLLSDEESMEVISPAPATAGVPNSRTANRTEATAKSSHIKPFVETGTTVAAIHKVIVQAGVVNYTTNNTRKGIIVSVVNVTDYRALRRKFRENNVAFYTHQLPEDRTTKIVLFGLPEMEPKDIEEALREKNIVPAAIKTMNIRNKKYEEQAMYLLHFSAGTISLAELRNVRAVNHHRVYFEYYNSKKNPMQCRNCQKYGHGSANCYRQSVCVKCADTHKSQECPLTQASLNPDKKLSPNKLKCANCGEHHTANYSGCKARPTPKTPAQPRPKPFTYNSQRFPALHQHQFPEQTQRPMQPDFANLFKDHRRVPPQCDMFNDQEIGQIIEDVFAGMRAVSSKKDLITLVIKITAKYCFNNV